MQKCDSATVKAPQWRLVGLQRNDYEAQEVLVQGLILMLKHSVAGSQHLYLQEKMVKTYGFQTSATDASHMLFVPVSFEK